MAFSALYNPSAPYSKMESWFYDTFIAPAMVQFYDKMEEELSIDAPAGSRLLDVGCGGGQILAEIARRRPGANLAGVDLSPEQVQRAKKRLAPFGGRVQVREGSSLDLPFPEGKFDLVLSNGSLKHWPEQALGLSECVRVLKPGGRLLVIEADRGCRLEDVDRLFRQTRLPRPFRIFFRAFYLTGVAGPAPDLDDARALAEDLLLESWDVYRTPSLPGLVIDGIKE